MMWNLPHLAWAHGGGGGGGGHGGGGFGGGHGGFGGGHMGGFGGGFGGHSGFGGFSGGHIGGYGGMGGYHSGIGSSSLGGIGHSGIGHSGTLGSGTLGGVGGLSGIGGHHAAGSVMHNPNSFTNHHVSGQGLSNSAAGNRVMSGYRGVGNATFAGTHAQGLLTHQASVGTHHSAFLQNHHVSNVGTGGGGHGLASAGASGLGHHPGTMGQPRSMGQHHHGGMSGNNFGHNRGFFGYPFFGFPFFGFGFGYPFFGYGYGLYGGYGYGLYGLGYGYGYGYPYYYGYNPYAYYYGPYGYGYGNYAYPYAYQQTQPVQPTQPATVANDAEVFAQKGENDFKAGDYKGAVYAWRHAVLDDPHNGVLTLMLAQGLFATGSYNEAAGAVQQALQMLPEDQWGVVVSNFRELYGKAGDYTSQLRALEKEVKQQPDDPAARFLLGYHYGFLGYPQHAVKQLDKALELAPADQLAQKLRDLFNAKLPKPADANGKAPADKEAGGGQPNNREINNKLTTIDVPAR
jgi:cytochrome c-type biogenesis protein CcmH/NrfG